MTVKKYLKYFINKNQNKVLVSLFITLGIVSLVFISLVGLVSIQNIPTKNSQASGVYQCAAAETLSGTNCLSAAISYPIYTEGCEAGYTAMDSVCVTFIQKICTDYVEGIIDPADSTLCKFNNINNVLLSEITDNDGRQCKGVGYNFKRYNVGLATTSTAGPIVCSNAISGVTGKANFRFIPRSINSIHNFITSQTGTSSPVCPIGYTVLGSQCSIAAKVTNCNIAGEYLDATTSICKTCPIDKYCLNTLAGETTTSICPNGGTLINNLCIASNKVNTTAYINGCTLAYMRFDQTCAIEEIRTHDLGCGYFYSSDFVNTLAVKDNTLPASALNICSTGGSTDFNNASVFKVSDLQCDGIGTAWYNYNVAYDPLVCGNNYDVNNKAAFRWSEKTFIKIVGLQKIGASTTICPTGWTEVANTQNCSQTPIVQRFAIISSCPVGSFAPVGSDQFSDCVIPCPSSSSSSSSVSVSSSSSSLVSSSSSTVAQQNVFNTTNPFGSINANAQSTCSSVVSGGGVIIITQATSSSSFPALSSSSSSSIKSECVTKANEYKEDNQCKLCPAGTIVTTNNPISIKDCIVVSIVEKPTIRTGGNQIIQEILLTIMSILILLAYIKVKKHHKEFLKGWFKI